MASILERLKLAEDIYLLELTTARAYQILKPESKKNHIKLCGLEWTKLKAFTQKGIKGKN
jgi:hypothetical protein